MSTRSTSPLGHASPCPPAPPVPRPQVPMSTQSARPLGRASPCPPTPSNGSPWRLDLEVQGLHSFRACGPHAPVIGSAALGTCHDRRDLLWHLPSEEVTVPLTRAGPSIQHGARCLVLAPGCCHCLLLGAQPARLGPVAPWWPGLAPALPLCVPEPLGMGWRPGPGGKAPRRLSRPPAPLPVGDPGLPCPGAGPPVPCAGL